MTDKIELKNSELNKVTGGAVSDGDHKYKVGSIFTSKSGKTQIFIKIKALCESKKYECSMYKFNLGECTFARMSHIFNESYLSVYTSTKSIPYTCPNYDIG